MQNRPGHKVEVINSSLMKRIEYYRIPGFSNLKNEVCMHVNGFRVATGVYQFKEDVFDSAQDILSESGDISEEGDDLYQADDSPKEVVVKKPQRKAVMTLSNDGGLLVNPNISNNDKFKFLDDVFGELSQKFQQIELEKDIVDHKIVQVQDGFNKAKDIYEQKLFEQDRSKWQTSRKFDEITNLKQERKKWIRDNKESEIGLYLVKATLGTMLSAAGGAILMIAMGIQAPAGASQLKIAAGGALTGGSIGPSAKNALTALLESYENEYMKKNPGATKREAFECAKGKIELARNNSHNDDPDSWSGISY